MQRGSGNPYYILSRDNPASLSCLRCRQPTCAAVTEFPMNEANQNHPLALEHPEVHNVALYNYIPYQPLWSRDVVKDCDNPPTSKMDALLLFHRLRSIDIMFPFQHIQPPSYVDMALLTTTILFLAAFKFQGKLWDRPDPYGYIYFERPQLKSGQDIAEEQSIRDVANHLEILNKDVVVFWGSQSGTAESLAHRLARDLHVRFGLNVLTADLSDYDAKTIAALPESRIAVFILATYGEGGPSDNAVEFWDWITRDNIPDLSRLKFLAFGLGSSNYKYYNKVVDDTAAKLLQAGASLLSPVGRADDAQGATEEDYLAWVEDVHLVLQRELQIQPKPFVYTPTVAVEEIPEVSSEDLGHDLAKLRNQYRVRTATSVTKALPICTSIDLLGPSSERPCLHMELDLAEVPELRYKTGDHLAVWPVNPEEEVRRLLKMLGRVDTVDDTISLKALDASEKLKISTPTTVGTLLRHQLEICGPVSRNIASELVQFAPNEESRTFLSKLGNDRDAFAQFRSQSYVTFGSLLEYASKGVCWTELPLSYLVESIPALQPRYYSISSSSVLSPRRLSITVRVSNTVLPDSAAAVIPGLTSNYLQTLSNYLGRDSRNSPSNSRAEKMPVPLPRSLYCQIRRTKFKLPVAITTPVVMIANGTGIAPFRAFLQERAKLHSVGRSVGRMMLFFGCRHPETDHLYRKEIEALQVILNGPAMPPRSGNSTIPSRSSNTVIISSNLLETKTAFSRLSLEEQSSQCRGHVQDVVANELTTVIDLLVHQNASLYICGGANMSREVSSRIACGYAELERVTADQGIDWVNSLKRTEKWKEDVWD